MLNRWIKAITTDFELAANEDVFRRDHVEIHRRVGSTMDVAARHIRVSPDNADGTLIVALQQDKGRGSGSRSWASPIGNAYLTRITAITGHEHGQEIEMIAACAVAEIISDLLPNAKVTIKFPNDVLIGGAKISGCLVPPSYDDDKVAGQPRLVAVGVGVNLAVAPQLPDGRATTSLAAHGVTCELSDFLPRFEATFTEILNDFRATQNFETVLERMGFLNGDCRMSLRRNDGLDDYNVPGGYQGFRVIEDHVYIRLHPGGLRHIHSHTTYGQPLRPGARRRVAAAAHAC